jgi:type IV secretion system protein VirB10
MSHSAVSQSASGQSALGQPVGIKSTALQQGYGSASPTPAPVREWEDRSIERDRERRAYQSLFASNVALSHRREVPESAGAKTTPNPSATSEPALASPSAPAQSYRLFEGTILETVLTNRLDSSFSGPINCMVTTDVYSYDGAKLLIPQGSRVLGEAKKLESFGEQRLAVAFHRIIMPDGYSVSLDQFKGLDQIGETGLRDQVNHHYLQVFGVSIALGALAGLSQSNTRYSLDESALDAYRQGVATSVSQSAVHVLDRYLNVLPTFTIREGYRIKVYLSQDLMLPAYEQHPGRMDL